MTPLDAGAHRPGYRPGEAQAVLQVRAQVAAGRAPVAGAGVRCHARQFLLVPEFDAGQDVAEAQAAPAAQVELVIQGNIVTFDPFDGQFVLQRHDMTADIKVGTEPEVARAAAPHRATL